MPTEDKSKHPADLFEQAMKNFEQALKAGLKLQEESARLWTQLLNQAAPPDAQKRWKALSEEFMTQTQKSLEEGVRVIEQNGRSSVDLLRKALAAAEPGSIQDAQSRLVGFWEGSLAALRDSALAVSQANARAAESWMACGRKLWEASGVKG